MSVDEDRKWYFDDATTDELRAIWDLVPRLGHYRLGQLWKFVFEDDYWYGTDEYPTGVNWFINFLLQEGLISITSAWTILASS